MKWWADWKNVVKAKAIEKNNRERILAVNPHVDEKSGIYFLTRTDEGGFRYAYIGQAVNLLSRLAGHLKGYQHIDLSIKSHGLYSTDNIYGWKIGFLHYPVDKLDKWEQYWIKCYADKGYQLRNKTSGSQGKKQIADYKPPKGYRDGIQQGRINLARELSNIADKHLVIGLKPEKQNNSISQKQYQKFMELLHTEKDGESDE